jgi:hypothetical protein
MGVVMGALPTGSVTFRHRQPSDAVVIHDHVRFGQHQIVAIARIIVSICARNVQHACKAQLGEAVRGSNTHPCCGELRPGGCSTEMINHCRSNANRKVLVKGVGEHLLPTAQVLWLWWPVPALTAPGTGNRHIDLFCYLIPGQTLITEVQDLLGGGGMSGRRARTHGDAYLLELLADRAPMNAQLVTDLAQRPTPGVQVGCTLNVHSATVTIKRWHRGPLLSSFAQPPQHIRQIRR